PARALRVGRPPPRRTLFPCTTLFRSLGRSQAIEALSDKDSGAEAIQGSLVVIRGKTIDPLVAEEQYYVGSLSPVRYVQWILSRQDRKSTRLNSSHVKISYAVSCLKKK